jgi:ribosomal protein S12 methylthiotransferase
LATEDIHLKPIDTPTVGFVSLGCPKATVDSERILTQLRAEGYGIAPSYDGADLVIVNTCGFIDAAVEESLEAIGEALAENGRVIVTGCLGARAEEVREAHPGCWRSPAPAYDAVMAAVHAHLPAPHHPFVSLVPPQGVKLTPRHYAYLKISEGCNHRCTFCIIPSLRGDLVSRPIGEVLRGRALVEAGVRELLVVAQDTSAYGLDALPARLLEGPAPAHRHRDLARAPSGSSPPGCGCTTSIPTPSGRPDPADGGGHILPYLDMPLQHGSPAVLKAMRRPAATERVLERLARWREICPELVLRSTFIVGFPGETEADFETLLDFIRAARARPGGLLRLLAGGRGRRQRLPDPVPEAVGGGAPARFMDGPGGDQPGQARPARRPAPHGAGG